MLKHVTVFKLIQSSGTFFLILFTFFVLLTLLFITAVQDTCLPLSVIQGKLTSIGPVIILAGTLTAIILCVSV